MAEEFDPAGDIQVQTGRVSRSSAALAAHGATFADVLHVRTLLTNVDDPPGYGTARTRTFPGQPRPASTTVEVSRLVLPDALDEVEVTAAVPGRTS